MFFKPLSEPVIAEYFRRVNPLDKAGAYDINAHGELIIARHTGSWTNIMGLPAELVADLLRREGLLASGAA